MAATGDRRIRGFKRWMKHQGIDCSDALLLSAQIGGAADSSRSLSISVKALCDLKEGDVVAMIPKESCLTVRTSAAANIIRVAGLGGNLGLAVAIMYERSLGAMSKWFRYFQVLPPYEPIPLLWSLPEIDSLLAGTELHKTVKEDKALVYQDWKECVEPLLASFDLNPAFFSIDEYFSAKSLVSSRAFEIDEFHGYGMVPLADLFNHKTAAENVHFTSVSSSSESDSDTENSQGGDGGRDTEDSELAFVLDSDSETGASPEISSPFKNEPTFMEMIIVKGVKAGDEVYNTYGYVGNAALLHRYGFTELDNPFDILNIDLEIIVEWSSSFLSSRSIRRRLSLWRKFGYSGCISQGSEYFEISFDGEPQMELLTLICIFLLPVKDFHKLDLTLSVKGETGLSLSRKENFLSKMIYSKQSKKLLVTRRVRQAFVSLANARENLYGLSSLEDDERLLKECCVNNDPKMYHSLVLRIGERSIIRKLRCFGSSRGGILKNGDCQRRSRKKLK